jgi:hypothetical protein
VVAITATIRSATVSRISTRFNFSPPFSCSPFSKRKPATVRPKKALMVGSRLHHWLFYVSGTHIRDEGLSLYPTISFCNRQHT